MHSLLAAGDDAQGARPIWFVTPETAAGVLEGLSPLQRDWATVNGFEPTSGRHLVLPDASGGVAGALFGLEGLDARHRDGFLPAKLATLLPAGTYRFANAPHDARLAVLGWLTGSYRFTRYKKHEGKPVRLALPEGVDGEEVSRVAEAVAFGRDEKRLMILGAGCMPAVTERFIYYGDDLFRRLYDEVRI